MAPEDTFDSQDGTPEGPVLFDRFQAVKGTARCVAAGGWEQRRETIAIDINQKPEDEPERPPPKARP